MIVHQRVHPVTHLKGGAAGSRASPGLSGVWGFQHQINMQSFLGDLGLPQRPGASPEKTR